MGAIASRYGVQGQGYESAMGAQQQAQAIAQQQAASQYLYGVGRGTQSSIAAQQARLQGQQALESQLALAGSGRGGSSGAMLDQAMRQNASTQQNIAAQSAIAVAQERQQAFQAAAAIDASRTGQLQQGYGMGQNARANEMAAFQAQAGLRTGAYTGAADIGLGYGGLAQNTEQMLYGLGNEEANRYTSALTGESALANQRNMQASENARQDQLALYSTLGTTAQTAGSIYANS